MLRLLIILIMMMNPTYNDGQIWFEIEAGDYWVFRTSDQQILGRDDTYLYGKDQEFIQDIYLSSDHGEDLFHQVKLDQKLLLPDIMNIRYNYAYGNDLYIGLMDGIYSLDYKSGEKSQVSVLSEERFKDLSLESIKYHGVNYLYSNQNLRINSSGDYLSYVSNKDHIDSLQSSLYVYDLEDQKESLLYQDDSHSYGSWWWLDDQTLISLRSSETSDLFMINLQGDIKTHALIGDSPMICDHSEDYIVYLESPDSQKLHLIQTKDFKEFTLDSKGQLIFRGDQKFYNNKWASLYSNDGGLTRYIQIFDLESHKRTLIDDLVDTATSVLDFNWYNESSLIVETIGLDDQVTKAWLLQFIK